jgi:hypothetical protein
MSPSKTKPKSDLVCWDCGATNDLGASECWLCHRRDWHEFFGSLSGTKPAIKPPPAPSPTLNTGWRLIVPALVAVGLGSVLLAPGLVILLLISVLPAWAIAEAIAHRRRKQGLPISTPGKVAWIVALSIVMPFLLGMALLITLFLICLTSGPPTFH